MISDYASLVTEIGEWLDRDDLTLRIPTFIQLTEKRLNKILDDPDMEIVTTLSGDGAALPDDYGSMVSIGTADGNQLRAMSNTEYASVLPQSGIPRYYTIREGRIYYVPGAATVTLVYRRSIPPLTVAAPENWLIARAPECYLYGALLAATVFLHEDERIGVWKSAWEEAIAELRMDGTRRKWGAGPTAARIRRP